MLGWGDWFGLDEILGPLESLFSVIFGHSERKEKAKMFLSLVFRAFLEKTPKCFRGPHPKPWSHVPLLNFVP